MTNQPMFDSPMPGAPATCPAAGAPATCPEGLPAKFWDAQAGQPRLDALIKSYGELERRLGGAGTMPASPDGYALKMPMDVMSVDPELNARLHQAGFTQEQTQLVYDLAAEHLVPYMNDLTQRMQADAAHSQLADHFGGEDAWSAAAGQLDSWGQANLPPEVYSSLSGSVDGVKTMYGMMNSGEPALGRASGPVNPVADEASLRALMRDPRYWRDHNPAIVQRVREGFARLYPG